MPHKHTSTPAFCQHVQPGRPDLSTPTSSQASMREPRIGLRELAFLILLSLIYISTF